MISELVPVHDSRKSFYGKARVITRKSGEVCLHSYNTLVVTINTNKVVLGPAWDGSQTTLRHVKEFLKQMGYRAVSKAQIQADYVTTNERTN